MKNQIISFALLFYFLGTKAESIKIVKTSVDKAIVYLAGATLSSTENFNLSTGINQLVFEGVAPNLDQSSLQASGKGNFVIMDVKFNVKFNEQAAVVPATSKNIKAINAINDSLVELNFIIDELNDQLNALSTEKNIILGNRLMKGETKQDTLALLKDAMEYLRFKLKNINSETYKLKRELYAKDELKNRLTNRLNELNSINNATGNPTAKANEALYQIIVTVMADIETTAKVTVSYFINQAGWKPSYDLRASSTNNLINVTHKAQLYQNTGVDWNNATLTLATSTPNQSIVSPVLNPIYLSFYQAYSKNIIKKNSETHTSYDIAQMPSVGGNSIKGADEDKDAGNMYSFTEMVENLIQTEYAIKIKYNIPCDGKEHLVIIQNKEIKADYSFSATPKLDANSFLVAKITNWEDLNLIPGESRIFFDGSYLGQSFINPEETNDTLTLSLGRDKSIVIKRKMLKDKTKQKLILDEKIMTYAYEITVKNTKSLNVSLNITDQIPLSTTKEIVVKLIDSSKANYDLETGKLDWDITMKPNETRKFLVTYEVAIPKDKVVANR